MSASELSFQPFAFRSEASATTLTDDEQRFIELFEASRNDNGQEGVNLDEETVNDILDNLDATDTYAVVDGDDEMVGVAAVDIQGSQLWLEGVAIDRYQRSCGIGGFVIEQLVHLARENDCSKITGYSQPNSRTVNFYRKHGGYIDESIGRNAAGYVPMTLAIPRE